MGDKSKIEWTDATWTPIRARQTLVTGDRRTTTFVGWHCAHVSEGCRNCYSEGINRRLGTGLDFKAQNREKVEIFLDEKMLTAPLRWKKPRMIFVCSMTDLFADFVQDEFIDRIFAVMALCPQHIFQILTKRPERMREYFAKPHPAPNLIGEWQERVCQAIDDLVPMRTDRSRAAKERVIAGPLPNVWLGTSCEDQPAADARIPHLLATPAAIRFLSCEPMLSKIDVREYLVPKMRSCGFRGITPEGEAAIASLGRAVARAYSDAQFIDWVICGGESGPGARPMHPDWARSLRDQCAAAGVPFFFKQWGEWWEVDCEGRDDDGDHVLIDIWEDERAQEFDPKTDLLIAKDGRTFRDPKSIPYETRCRWMTRLGKKRAGRLLDGVEHNGFPEARP